MLTWYRIKLNKPSLTALAPRLRDRQALLVSRHSCLPKVHAYKIRATTFYEDIVALQGLRPPRRDAACVELEAGSGARCWVATSSHKAVFLDGRI